MAKMIEKNWKQMLWKTINVVSSVALIANMSMIGVFVAPKVASAADLGFLTPTSYSGLSGIVSSATNAYTDNGQYATFGYVDSGKYGTFGITLPSGATVNGIEVALKAKTSNGGNSMNISLTDDNGTTWGSAKAATGFTSSVSTITVGNSSDLWGRADWTATDLNNSHFAVKLAANFGNGKSLEVDVVNVKVYYTPATYCPTGLNPLNMWDRTPNAKWSTGEISGYFEGEDIPVQLELNGLTAGVQKTIRVDHEYMNSSSVVGIERFEHANAPVESGITFNANRLNFTIGAPTTSGSNPSYKTYTLTFTPTGTTATLYFDALLGPNAHSFGGGSSLHASLTDCGQKSVPIAVNKIFYHSLAIDKTDNTDPIQLNATTTYTINATNSGKTDGGEKNFTVTDTLPAGMEYVIGSATPAPTSVVGQVITWNFGTVADGTTKTITYQAKGVAVGTHTNTASVSADGATPVTTTEPTTVLGQCGLVVEKHVDNTTAIPGDTLTYTITYENKGTAFCTGGGVKIYDQFNGGLTYVANSAKLISVTNDQDYHSGDPAPEIWGSTFNGMSDKNLGNLHEIGPGEKGVIELKATVNGGDLCKEWDVRNSGWTDGVEPQSDVQFASEKTHVTTPCYGKLKVKKYVDSGSATPDQWSFTLGNETKSPASGTNWVIFENLTPGSYTVTESTIPDYHQVSTTCDNVVVSADQTATCEFHNTRDTGRITFDKVVVGGTAKDSEFTFTVNNTDYKDGDSASLPTGTYDVTESGPDGYTLTDASGACSLDQQGNITLTVTTQGGTCTITNTRDTGKLIVHKNVINPDGQDISDAHQFSVLLNGVDQKTIAEGTDATYNDLPTGTYTVTENPDGDYEFVSYSSDADVNTAGAQVTIVKGQTTELTVTNKQKKATIIIYKDVKAYNGDDIADATSFGVTSTAGNFSIAEGSPKTLTVNPGAYTFTETANSNYVTTSMNPKTLTVGSNGQASYTFVNKQKASSLSGKKFEDKNANGVKDAGEDYLSNWKIYLDLNNNNQYDNGEPYDMTDGNGAYSFTNLIPGTYTVREVMQNGWLQTAPAGDEYSVTLGVNESVTGKNFGNYKYGKISGYKYEDKNGNGHWDYNEPALHGWTITLSNGQQTWTDTTDNNGYYSFTGLTAGTYSLSETMQTGWVQTDAPSNVVVTSGTYSQHNDFGNYKYGKVTGTKFEDKNGNGKFDAGDTAVANWPISLYKKIGNSWVLQSTVSTDANGHYAFTGLTYGEYKITEDVLTGWVPVIPVNVNDGYKFTITSGFDNEYNFLNYKLGSISGYKWNDLNGDGIWQQDEPGIANWTITLSGAQNGVISTDANGYYEFVNLPKGTYTVTEATVPNWMHTTSDSISNLVIVNSDTNLTGNNFGNFEYGKISGYKMDQNENGLEGWQICLSTQSVDEFRVANFVQESNCTLTDDEGYYEFTNLTYGTYVVSETQQYGWTQLYPTDPNTHTVNVVSGTDSQNNDFMNRMNDFGVSIEKSAPAKVNAGGNITYTLDWTVTGNTDVYNASITDPLPANTTFVSADNGGTYDSNTNTVTWDLGTVTPDDSGTVTLVVKTATPLDNGTVIENTGTICGTGNLPNEQVLSFVRDEIELPQGTEKCDTSTTTTTTESAPVLGITKTNDKAVGAPGDLVNYTITWSVDGNSKATNVTITDVIPVELIVDTATISNGGTYNPATRTITWNLGTQVPHADGKVTYSTHIVNPLATGTQIVNVTKITSHETDPKFWEAQSTTTVKSAPVLTIDKTVTPTETTAGQQVTYTVVIKNVGNDTAVNVKMTDLLPAGFTFVEFGGSSHTFSLGNLAAGAQTTVTYKVNIDSSVTPGNYDNLAVASADNHPNVSDKATVKIGQVLGEEALPKLTITKTAEQSFVNPGGHVTYHVKITNVGDAPAINVQLQDVMPAGFTFDVGGITKVWSLGDLAVGASFDVAYTAIADQTILPGNYENIAVAWADNADKVTASVPVEIRAVQVLGAELPETGAGVRDYIYFFAAGLVLVFALYLFSLTFSKETEQ